MNPTTPSAPDTKPGLPNDAAWIPVAGSTPGKSHLREGRPCQDAALAAAAPRPFLVVADGRGSAHHSAVGARSACHVVAELVRGNSLLFKAVLDEPDDPLAERLWPMLQDQIFRSVRVRQHALALERHLEPGDLEHTLLAVVVGVRRVACLHVGDGVIVIEDGDGLRTVSRAERGEYANTTCFVGPKTQPRQLRGILLPAGGVQGIIAMSDGAAERLIHSITETPTPGLTDILARVRREQFDERLLHRFLTDTLWEPDVLDDRSLAILCRTADHSGTPPATVGTATNAVHPESQPDFTCWRPEVNPFDGSVEHGDESAAVKEDAPRSDRLRYWRRLAVLAGALALWFAGMAGGLLLGRVTQPTPIVPESAAFPPAHTPLIPFPDELPTGTNASVAAADAEFAAAESEPAVPAAPTPEPMDAPPPVDEDTARYYDLSTEAATIED